jgi:S-DNA-T family DNA segregation ATPase FtsK/SpoIIIE
MPVARATAAGGKRAVGWLFRRIAGTNLSPLLRREVLALSALALAVLVSIPLAGLDDGRALLSTVGGGLRAVLGRGVVIVPLAFLWLAGEALFSHDDGARTRRTIGYLLSTIAVVASLSLAGAPAAHTAGGYLGAGVSRLAVAIAGAGGAWIILATIGVIGIYFLTGAGVAGAVRAGNRARVARRERMAASRLRQVEEAHHRPETPAPEPVQRPVINFPRPGSRSRQRGERDAEPAESPEAGMEATEGMSLAPQPLPDISRLALYDGGLPDKSELERKAELIQDTLGNFKVDARVREVHPGPAVTLFTLQPAAGVKVRRITELQNDLALALAAPSIRIEAPVPGMARVGIDIPDANRQVVGLRETIESPDFQRSKAKIPLALGRDVNGESIIGDLAKMPHLLIAGATGSGKSVCINGIIGTFLLTRQPGDLQMVMIDPKMVELVGFNGVPHLKGPVVTEMDKVVAALRLVLREMERRYHVFSSLGVRNIDGYNLRRNDDPSLERLPYLVVIIDELADLMMTTPEEVESLLVRLAQMARATGIHLLIATQRPSVDVLTGLIKANIPARIAFAVTSQTDSRVVLDIPGAERLLGKGDMLFLPPDAAKPKRIQGPYIEDKDLQYVVEHWKKVVPNHQYDPEWVNLPGADGDDGADGHDALYDQALQIVRKSRTASASMLQRRLKIGYNRAARIIEQMEEEGVIGPPDGSRSRPVYDIDEED